MVSTATISVALRDIDFPASREDMVEYARSQNAPDDVIDALESLPKERYETMAQVWHEIGEEE